MNAADALIGIDLGTTAVKVLACGADGTTFAEATQRYPLETPRPGWVEQDVETIYRTAMNALQGVLQELRLAGHAIRAIGFSSAMHAVCAVDELGRPLTRLWTWMDRRAAPIAETWRRDGTAAELYARTGAPVHPMLPICKLAWMREHDRATFDAAARFVGMKELFVYRWTNEWLIDEALATATGLFDTTQRRWDDRALTLAGVDATRLSTPAPTSTRRHFTVATVADALGVDAETAIVLASSDGALANLGIGAVTNDRLALTMGTSGALRVVSQTPALDRDGRTFSYVFDDTHWLVGGATSSAGAVLEWIFGMLLPDVAPGDRVRVGSELAASVPDSAGLTVLPFLSGERAPWWRADLRGAVVGLDLAHTRAHLARAAFEGVVFALRSVYDVMRELVAQPANVMLSGGLTHQPFVRQLVADTFGIDAILPDRDEASAFGAAMMAGLAIGALPSLEDVAARVHTVSVIRPNRQRDVLEAAYGRYRREVERALAVHTA